ncbi:MAG: Spermidine Putrescine ABC transporter permease component potC (TC_3.A.1.11.1) [uncultured Acetobacteraceae bacterium]|uniref:Spermidine Putrescine ABC transporter permease component potC (TC_3.A.1.11.1) n=1 Tax=uncultured Acetobacteraceae bacterium TaxID=169975 RepID=A0A6J4HV59_9PROT|nr:MAG: Spermidine Putrescine ABC transporter permease component potC (TC_3.A.1.11.1) [uncultured Acetobacteraceae bacterium]
MVWGSGFRERLGRFAFRTAAALGLGLVLLPLVLVAWLSFFSNEILSLPPEGYSLRWYGAALAQPQFIGGLWTSAAVALLATAVGLLVTLPASFVLTRRAFPGREAVVQLLMSPLVVPAIVIGSALYMAFVEFEVMTEMPLTGSVAGLALGHALLTIPWGLRLLTANLAGLNPAIEEAALSLGARPVVAVAKVTLPLIWPGVVAAALFSFVVSFGNLEVSLFLVAPGQTTLPIAILQYLQWKIDPTIAAVSVVQILVVAAGLLLTDRLVGLGRVV